MMNGLLQRKRMLPFNQNFLKEKGQLPIIGLCITHISTMKHPVVFYHMGYIEPSVAEKHSGEYYYKTDFRIPAYCRQHHQIQKQSIMSARKQHTHRKPAASHKNRAEVTNVN
jgi:hypothetical protein